MLGGFEGLLPNHQPTVIDVKNKIISTDLTAMASANLGSSFILAIIVG